MHKITEKQNETEFLNMLAAQRQIYSEGKTLNIIQFVISIVLSYIIVIIKPLLKNFDIFYFAMSCIPVIIMIASYVLKSSIANKKIMAATIQNRFDFLLYSFQWDETKHGDLNEIQGWIHKYLLRYLKKNNNLNAFIDWYPIDDSSVGIEKSRILCQQCNVYWDGDLKKNYKTIMNSLMIVLIIISIVLAIISYNATVASFATNTLLPIIPVAFYIYTTNKTIARDIERLEYLKRQMTNLVELMKDNSIGIDTLTKQSLNIQGQIYEHRKSGTLVLDFIYNKLKAYQESVAKANANRAIQN